MRDELDIQTLQRAKANAVAYYHAEDTDHEFWEQCVEDIDDEIKDIGKEPDLKPARSRLKWWVWFISVAVVITILYMACTGCQFASGCGTAIKGLGGDITWAADGYMENMNKEK